MPDSKSLAATSAAIQRQHSPAASPSPTPSGPGRKSSSGTSTSIDMYGIAPPSPPQPPSSRFSRLQNQQGSTEDLQHSALPETKLQSIMESRAHSAAGLGPLSSIERSIRGSPLPGFNTSGSLSSGVASPARASSSRNSASSANRALPDGWGGGKQAWGEQQPLRASNGVPLFIGRQWATTGSVPKEGRLSAGAEAGQECFSFSEGSTAKRAGPLLRQIASPQSPQDKPSTRVPSARSSRGRSKTGLGAVEPPPKTTPDTSIEAPCTPNITSKGLLVDLIEASRKSFAAGLGDWDLQTLEWGHPQFKEQLLKGPLGPESLKARYGLKEPDQLKLYRLLYNYTVGFCDAVDEPTAAANNRQELLELVFKAYSQLWDEALGVAFSSEMVSTFDTKNSALALVADLQARLDASEAEKAELHQRLNQVAKETVDNMLVHRMDTDRTRTTEGEVHMLTRAADKLSLKLAGAEAKEEGLLLANKEAQARMEAAEAITHQLMHHNNKLKRALGEQQAVSMRLAAKIKDLDQQLAAKTKHSATLLSELEEHRARVAPPEIPKSELEMALADKTRAFNLLHTDFVVKMAELDESRHVHRELKEQMEETRTTFNNASKRITQAQDEKERFRRKWESNCMYTEDLEATNARLSLRNHELVRAYWPLMSYLREIEARCGTLEVDKGKLLQERQELTEKVAADEELLKKAEQFNNRMKGLEATMAVAQEADEVPASLLAEMTPEAAERLRVFVCGANLRIESLSAQLVTLVDMHTSASADLFQFRAQNRDLQIQVNSLEEKHKEMEAHFSRQVMRVAAQATDVLEEELAEQKQEDIQMDAAGRARITSIQLQMQELQERMDLVLRVRSTNEHHIAVLETERAAALHECTKRDKWLDELCSQSEAFADQISRLLEKDPNSPLGVSVFTPSAALDPKPHPPHPQMSVPLPNASSPASPAQPTTSVGENVRGSVVGGSEGGVTNEAGARAQQQATDGTSPAQQQAGGTASAGEGLWRLNTAPTQPGIEGQNTARASAHGSQPGIEGQNTARASAHGSRVILLGRLAVKMQVPAETCRPLVALDHSWEVVAASLERLLQWGSGLVTEPVQIARVHQLEEQAAVSAAVRQKDQDVIHELTNRSEAAEQQLKETAEQLQAVEQQLAETKDVCSNAQSGRAAFESALNGAREELEQLHARHSCMEREYWVIKAQLLDVELTGGEAISARDRAVQDAERAVERMQIAEKESDVHRHQRKQLEADVVGLKAWVRTMEGTERAYHALLVELSQAQGKAEEAEKLVATLQERLSVQSTQLEAARHQVSTLTSEFQQSLAQSLDERQGEAAADQAVRAAAAAQVASAEEGRGIAERRASEAEDRHKAAAARLADIKSQLVSVTEERASLRQQLFSSQQQVVRLSTLIPSITSGTQALERMVSNMESRLGAFSSKLASLDSTSAPTGKAGTSAEQQQHGSLLSACHKLADCAEGMADSMASTLAAVDNTGCGVGEQIEVLIRLEGLVNDLSGVLNNGTSTSMSAEAPTSTTTSSGPSASTPALPSKEAAALRRLGMVAPAATAAKLTGEGGWDAPGGPDVYAMRGTEEVPTLAASVVSLQTSLSAARTEAATAAESERQQRQARLEAERQVQEAGTVAKQQAARLEQLEGKLKEAAAEVAAVCAARDAATVTQITAEEKAASAAVHLAAAERERDDALQRAKAASDTLNTERTAIARLQKVSAEAASASLQAQQRKGAAPQAAGSTMDAQAVDTVLQLANARAELLDAQARTILAESTAKAAVADAEAARASAVTATEAARNAEIARLEVTSLLAECRRAQEGIQDMVRHAEQEAVRQQRCVKAAEEDASRERERADGLSRALLDIQVAMRTKEGERALALSALVDESITPCVKAAAAEAAAAAKKVAVTAS